MTSIAELYRLQEVDLALQAARDDLTDVQSRLGEPEELIEARRAAEERQEALRVAEKDFKERDWEADEQRRTLGQMAACFVLEELANREPAVPEPSGPWRTPSLIPPDG